MILDEIIDKAIRYLSHDDLVDDIESLRPYIEYYELCEKDCDKYDNGEWNKRFNELVEQIEGMK